MAYQNYLKLKARSTLPDPSNMSRPLVYISASDGFEIVGDGYVYHYRRVEGENYVSTSDVEYAWAASASVPGSPFNKQPLAAPKATTTTTKKG